MRASDAVQILIHELPFSKKQKMRRKLKMVFKLCAFDRKGKKLAT